MRNLALLVALCLSLPQAFGAESMWKQYNSAGENAYKQGDLNQAAEHFRSALTEAKKPTEQSDHLATSLLRLGEVYKLLGRNSEADPLLRSYALIQKQMKNKSQHLQNGSTTEKSKQQDQSKQPNTNGKSPANSGTQKMGGGWDANDIRINRRFKF